METFSVYVVGAVGGSGEALAKVAEAMASRYGLPADDLLGRLNRGRFRVKAGVDRATADTLKRDLEGLGARVQIDPATGASEAVKRASIPPPNRPTPQPRASTPPPMGSLQSGLSAAFTESADADLGALDQFANLDKISLSSVDGHDNAGPSASSFEPPGTMSASIGPASAPPAPTAPKPRDVPVEMSFAPPDDGAEIKVDIAPDEIEHRARKAEQARKNTPTATPLLQATPVTRASVRVTPVATSAAAPVVTRVSGRLGPFGDERVRLAVGVAVAILLGLLPAHLIASSWERSAYARVDAKVDQQQKTVETPEDWAALDAFRDRELEQKKSERRSIAMVAMLIWAAAGAGIAYVWFRRVPWDRLDAPA